MNTKLRWGIIILITLFLSMTIIIYTTTNNKENNVTTLKGLNYDEVMKQGLQNDRMSLLDVLYEEPEGENKILIVTSNNALAAAYMAIENDVWAYSRITPFYDFESSANPPSPYMSGGIEVKIPGGGEYYLAMGKIFNEDIAKITISDNNAIVKEKNGNKFWFRLLDNKDTYKDIKVFDKNNTELYE